MQAFDTPPDRLPGPAALRSRRQAAVEALATLEMPTTDLEEWRYSRIGELSLADWSPATEPGDPAWRPGPLPGGTRPAAVVVLVDGHLVALDVDEALAAKGLVVRPAGEADGPPALGVTLPAEPQPFVVLNDAYAPSPVEILVPPGLAVDRPVVVHAHASTEGSASFPRLVVTAGEDSDVTVVEEHHGAGPAALVVPVTELHAGRAARLRYAALQCHPDTVWQIGEVAATADTDATLTISAAAFGGHYARTRIDCRLLGRGSTGNLSALYFAGGDQMLDFRTFQDHVAPDTTSDLLFKGAVDDRSRSVYTGMIRVRPGARGTNAFQTNRNINLSEDAWAESVPNLEIENNEVRCSHASTVGPIDVDQLFYLESRGVPPHVAERLILTGFFDEVIARLPDPALQDQVRSVLSAQLDARESR